MKKLSIYIFITLIGQYLLAQTNILKVADSSQCFFSIKDSLYYKKGNKELCDGEEIFKRYIVGSEIIPKIKIDGYIKIKYDNGNIVSKLEFDSTNNLVREIHNIWNSKNSWTHETFYLSNGRMIYNVIKNDSSSLIHSWNYDGFLIEKTIIINNKYQSYSYFPNGKIQSIFICDYSRNIDCVELIYDVKGKIWLKNIYRPLTFSKLDSLSISKIPFSTQLRGLISVGPDLEYDNGKIVNKNYFKNGLLYRSESCRSRRKIW